jgi:hypothetical protein
MRQIRGRIVASGKAAQVPPDRLVPAGDQVIGCGALAELTADRPQLVFEGRRVRG